jgi:hypothetical protein
MSDPDDLSPYAWHTGGAVRPMDPETATPLLFRDLGPVAMQRFLEGKLVRLAGPTSPVTYLRTATYREPYADGIEVGRLALLPCALWRPWHAGVDEVFVTRADRAPDLAVITVLPARVDQLRFAREATHMRSTAEAHEHLGADYRAWREAHAQHLARFNADASLVEPVAAPLRARYQSADQRERDAARSLMDAIGLTEHDLCGAWHHLTDERRAHVRAALARVPP